MELKYLWIILAVSCWEVSSQTRSNFNYEPSDEQNRQKIRPKLLHGRHKRSLEHTLKENGLHISELVLMYHHNDKNVIIDLRLNDQLIPEGHFISYQTEDAEKIVKNLTKSEINLCHYHGTVRGSKKSRVALSTCNGINGIVTDENILYYIQPGPNQKLVGEHLIIKQTASNFDTRCGTVDKSYSPSDRTVNFRIRNQYKRAASDNRVRGPYNSNTDSLFVELIVVVDNSIYMNHKEDISKVHTYVIDLINIVSSFYVPVNIFIALTGVEVWTQRDEIEVSSKANVTLKNFREYRIKELGRDHQHDNAHLLLKNAFDHGLVGMAYKGQMCTTTNSVGITAIGTSDITGAAAIMAHEIGHNFGLEHDNPQNCICINKECIMHETTSNAQTHWSSCSLDQFKLSFHNGATHCLKNRPTKLFDGSTCGNGFVESDEECDCGIQEHCDNACCDSKLCILHKNATCATGKCCDLSKCQLQTAGYECRKSKGECDLSEYCNGMSEYCPKDVFKRDTEPCGLGKAYCYQGLCQSHLDQCQLLWGPSGQPVEKCFETNINGDKGSNCGLNKETNIYKACDKEDVSCGLLHCQRLPDNPLRYGNHQQLVTIYRSIGKVINCASVIFDYEEGTTDPGLAPNGAKCGTNKMCVNQKCVSVERLRERGVGSTCPDDCNGNGICNSKGNCHCFRGFSPPTCIDYGVGGSVDSGPLINFPATSRLYIVAIVGILLFITLTMFGITYYHQNNSIQTPGELASKVSNARREFVRKISNVTREVPRRISFVPREIARRASNNFTYATEFQIVRSNLRRTDGSRALANSRELILNIDNL